MRRSRTGRAKPGRCLGLAWALDLSVVWPGAVAAGEPDWGSVAPPLRIVNLDPFHLLFGVPGSRSVRVLAPGSSSELIASMDMASHLERGYVGMHR